MSERHRGDPKRLIAKQIILEESTRGVQERVPAPSGWMTKSALARELKVGRVTLTAITEQQRGTHPEWFRDYLDTGGHLAEYYHPDLVSLIKQQFENRVPAPSGWMTKDALAQELKVGTRTLATIAEQQRAAHPEWFRDYLDTGGHLREYYHPDLVSLICQQFEGRVPAPSGWMTKSALARELKVGTRTLATIAEQQRAAHPEWFHDYFAAGGQLREHYQTELVSLICQQFEGRVPAPSGWMTKDALARELKVGRETLTAITEQQRAAHPEWFHDYLDTTGRLTEHYHPKLVQLIRDQLAKREQPPAGWMTKHVLARELQVARVTLTAITEQQRGTHPEWFRDYLDTGGHLREHYHPDLITEIRRRVIEMKQRNGTKTVEDELKDTAEKLDQDVELDAQDFRAIVGMVGGANVMDVLLMFHPQFKDVPIEKAKRILGDCLGDVLVTGIPFGFAPFERIPEERLNNPTLQVMAYEALKQGCLIYYNQLRKNGIILHGRQIADAYLQHVTDQLAGASDKIRRVFDDPVHQALLYFESLYTDIEKPIQLVDEL